MPEREDKADKISRASRVT